MKRVFASPLQALLGAMLVLLLSAMQGVATAQPLVDVEWAAANAGKPGIVFIDFQPATDFLRGHLAGSVNSNYAKDGWREERADKVPDMLPTKLDKLLDTIGKMGIDNATHVVLVAPGMNSTDMGMATRVYWTFKVLGHDQVSVLDGGMAAYSKDPKNKLVTGVAKPEARTFKANVRKDMIIGMEDVRKAQASGVPLVDHRPEDQYAGINRHGMATESGTIAGAKNLPNAWLTVNGGGKFRNKSQLEQLYKVAGVPTTGEQVAFCNTGHWASVGWFVSSELMGNKQTKLYDGSMVEWTMLKGGPVETRVKLQ